MKLNRIAVYNRAHLIVCRQSSDYKGTLEFKALISEALASGIKREFINEAIREVLWEHELIKL